MTLVTGGFTTYQAVANREDLSNAIYDISPTDTPFMSAVARVSATNVLHEWQTDSLAAATTANAQLEGDIVTRVTSAPTVRVTNVTQIFMKNAGVSHTQQNVDHAGVSNYLAYQVAKKSKELKRDIETVLLANQGAIVGGDTTARTLRSMNSWLATNTARSTGGVDATLTSAASAESTTGNLRAITEAIFDTVLASAWAAGGDPTMVICRAANKQLISDFTGRANTRDVVQKNTIQAAAGLYAGDFSTLTLVPDRFCRARDVWFVDPGMAAVAYLGGGFNQYDLGKTGAVDSTVIEAELTLEMRNEAAHGLIADSNAAT